MSKHFLFLLLASSLLLTTCRNKNFKLDHFLAYSVSDAGGGSVPGMVYLDDQFLIDSLALGFPVGPLRYFCNPLDKNGEGIKDPMAHLTWYVMTDNAEHKLEIRYSNQFTGYKEDTLRITKMAFLLVPTEKIEPGSKFPMNLDHYIGYVVDPTKRFSKTVTLKDQFISGEGTVTELLFFCTPASKGFGRIRNHEDHLAVYRVASGAMPDRNVRIRNQFGPQEFVPQSVFYLLVPTKKKGFRRY